MTQDPPDAPGRPDDLPPRTRWFANALDQSPRRRVTLVELWHILDEADPTSRTSATRRALLLDTLT